MVALVMTVFGLAGLIVAGCLYLCMGCELRRKGRRVTLFPTCWSPRARWRVYRQVFVEYHQLKHEEGEPPMLAWLIGLFFVGGLLLLIGATGEGARALFALVG